MENKKVCLIDADSLIYKVCFNKDLKDVDDFGLYKIMLDNWIQDIITTCECTYYHGFLTSGRTFRHDVATNREYKSGRPFDKPRFYYELLKHMIQKWGFTSFVGLEAEDLVAIHTTYLGIDNVVIAKIDHDLDQVAGKHYNYVTKEFKDITREEAHCNLHRSLLTGCSTDKIQGIPGIGIKKAEKIITLDNIDNHLNLVLQEYNSYYGLVKGIHLFAETFKLIFLLRTLGNVGSMLNLEYSLPEPLLYIPLREIVKEDF